MADYPPTPSFGMNYGHPVRNMTNYSDIVPPPSVKAYGSAITSNATSSQNASASNEAYKHNNSIPGFSDAALASGIPPLPIFKNWRNHPESPAMALSSDRPANGLANTENEMGALDFAKQQKAVVDGPRYPQRHDRQLANSSRDCHSEDGELSDDEMEKSTKQLELPSNGYIGIPSNNGVSSLAEDVGGIARQNEPTSFDAFSTYPKTSHNSLPQKPTFIDQTHLADNYRNDHLYDSPALDKLKYQQIPAQNLSDTRFVPNSQQSVTVKGQQSLYLTDKLRNETTFNSLADARRGAQNAILNLLPAKVRLHHYVDEGFDEDFVRGLFDELGLSTNPSGGQYHNQRPDSALHNRSGQVEDPSHESSSNTSVEAGNSPALQGHVSGTSEANQPLAPVNAIGQGFAPDSSRKMPSSVPSAGKGPPQSNNSMNNSEERKDRIARLLAEKSGKMASANTSENITSGLPSAPAVENSASTLTAAKEDKARLLKQKMEALQKSREARARKPTNKPDPTQNNTDFANNAITARQSQSKSQSPRVDAAATAPSIPGLFLTHKKTTSLAVPNSPSFDMMPVNQRKRPVAADFDEPTPIQSDQKRPFGHSRSDHSLVIDVSDEESVDSEDDLDQTKYRTVQHGQADFSINGSPPSKTTRDLPPLSDYPPQWPSSKSALSQKSASVLSQAGVKPLAGRPEVLQKKELEIQEMKRKIAEAERRKKMKLDSSGSLTPSANVSVNVVPSAASPPDISSTARIDASLEIERLLDEAGRQVAEDKVNLAEAHTVEMEKVKELEIAESEQNRLRMAKIESDLPIINAEVESYQQKLINIRAEMAKLEGMLLQGLEQKRLLADEMRKLGQEVETQLEAEKQKFTDIVLENDGMRSGGQPTQLAAIPTVSQDATDHPHDNQQTTATEISTSSKSDDDQLQLTTPDIVMEDQSSITSSEPRLNTQGEIQTLPAREKPDSPTDHGEAVINSGPSKMPADHEAPKPIELKSLGDTDSDVDMEESYSPDSESNAPEPRISLEADDNHASGSAENMSDEGASMSESESDSYEPPEPAAVNAPTQSKADSPPFSPAPPESSISPPATNMQGYSNQANAAGMKPRNGRQSRAFEPLQRSPLDLEKLAMESQEKSLFTKYESPLRYLRSYRLNPNYSQEIAGGFRSLTYSNHIDNEREFCPFELAGGKCNDNQCEYQHFGTVALADDNILVELGNSSGYGNEAKAKFVSGLKNVLTTLRVKKIKDFHTIASEIVSYRSNFVADDCQVVLDDKTT